MKQPPHPCGEAHPNWKGDQAGNDAKHARARQLYQVLGPCEQCGEPAIDRHHLDGDAGNNEPSNIAFLCRLCHMTHDGRLGRLHEARLLIPESLPYPCQNCTRPYKPLRQGRCPRCAMYFYRHGTERPPVPTHLREEKPRV